MALFDTAKCNPPHEYDSQACFYNYWNPRWFEWQKDIIGRSRQVATKLKGQAKYVSAYADMETRKSQERISKIRKDTTDRWKQVAMSKAGVAGKMSGEFTSDEALVKPPRAKKIQIRSTPSVQIAGLESKAFSEGTTAENKFKGINRKRPK